MDLPASYYGKVDKRNPVIIAFARETNSFITVMKKRASSPTREDHSAHMKGIKIFVEIWKKYKNRLPPSFYQEHMLQVADVLFELKFYDMALWYGYKLHLQEFTSVDILDIEDMDHFKASFFPKGLDTDQDTLLMMIRALHGCARCTFEQVKAHHVLTNDGLYKLLCVLDLLQFIMQAFQHYDSLCWQMYNASVLIYNICRYLMTNNYSTQALEYLLWASFSIELCVPLMTSKNVPWLVTLYCAVCQCYYDTHAAVQGEVFARRALVKINELANLEEQWGIPTSGESKRTYKEASIKLATMFFKRAVFEARTKIFRFKTKRKLSDIPNAPWPRNTTEQILSSLFEGGAAQFLAVLEALKDSSKMLPPTGGAEDFEITEVVLELFAAGISLLSEYDQKNDRQLPASLRAVTSSSSLLDLAIAGENNVCFEAAVAFIKLLYYNKQPEVFSEYSREMLTLLSGLKGQSSETAELELGLLYYYSCVQKEKQKTVLSVSDELTELVKTLHKYVHDSGSELDRDLVLSVILFVWEKVSSVIERAQHHQLDFKNLEKWAWCLSVLCEVAFTFEPCTTHYCIMTGEMTLTLGMLLESASKHTEQKYSPEVNVAEGDVGIVSSFSLNKSSSIQLLQKLCVVVKKCLEALSKGMRVMLPQDGSALIDCAYMQKYRIPSSTSSFEEGHSEDQCPNAGTSKHTWNRDEFLLVVDLHLHLNAFYYKAFIGLMHGNAAAESDKLQLINKNKVSKAVFLMQKALREYTMDPGSTNIMKQLKECAELIRKAGLEERKLYMSTVTTHQCASSSKDRGIKDEKDCLPPPPVLITRSDHSLSFVPAPYYPKQKVCWYQLLGHAAEGTSNTKVRLGDCYLAGTGSLIPAESGRCVLKVEGLDPNQKYVFAVAAYNNQGDLVGNSIGETTIPMLASPLLPLLTAWAYLAQVAFQTKQHDIAKRACQKLWSHYTYRESRENNAQYELVAPRLQVTTLHHSSLILRHSVFVSIFIETDINILRGSLWFNIFSERGLFIWEQIARLEECERMLVAIDLIPWLIDHSDALQAVIICYGLVTPLIYHQIPCQPMIQVLIKCLNILEESLPQLKQKWTGRTSEALMHRIGCITYYLYKALHTLKENEKAAALMDCGVNLIQEIYEAQQKLINKPVVLVMNVNMSCLYVKKADAVVRAEIRVSPQMKALLGTNKVKINENTSTITLSEDHTKMLDFLLCTPKRRAFQEVMKLKQKTLFIESSTLLLERALEEGEAALVVEWGHCFMELLRKRTATSQNKTKGIAPGNELQDNAKRKVRQGIIQRARTSSEKKIGKNLSCFKKQVELRKMHCEERVWRTNLNYVVAQAHLALFYQSLDQLQEGLLLHRYSQLNPLNFSMTYSGVSLKMRTNLLLSRSETILERDRTIERDTEAQNCGNSYNFTKLTEKENGSAPQREQYYDIQRQTAASILFILTNAALHLRRAMVLAHRSSHWAILRTVAQTVWDQYCRTACIAQRGLHDLFMTPEQQSNIFSPLLVLATKLIMDMLTQLGLWSVYGKDMSVEETQSCLYFSPSLDETTKIDMRWVITLVIHTLEHLHDIGKWEKLAHLALHFNTYTRDHYALIVSPLLITAQRKLLERIELFKGPPVPQPHHIKTKEVTGHDVTYKSYMGIQLLSGWKSTHEKTTTKKKAQSKDQIIDAEVQRSMALVCVPLDVEDTLYWYRKSVEKTSSCLQFFQHSRSQLQRLLANTQSCYAAQVVRSGEPSRSASMVDSNPVVITVASVKPCDLMEKDYRTIESLYSLPLSPEHVPTITAAYTTAIDYYFHENKCDSMTVVALHELGNLHYYNGNAKAAQSCWTKSVNTALKSPDALQKWDGVTFGGCSLQHRLKLSGIWGCLQAALLTAKIAQYIITTDINKRTDCCLQSAHLFKCVLCCSLAQPQSDLHYASDLVIEELLPGVDLFSDPSRLHLSTTIASLNFICQWLFSTGHYMKLLPMLALYLYFVGSVCRDVQRTIECKILKIRTLTELGLFTEAVKETLLLTKGAGIRLPHGHYIHIGRDQLETTFSSTQSVLDNIEMLEDLVNCDLTPGVRTLYGSTLCLQFNLAHAQLILAISATIYSPLEVPDGECQTVSKDSKEEDTKLLNLESLQEPLTVGLIKYLLLEAVSSLLNTITKQLTAYSHVDKVELTVESSLLKAKLYFLKGQAAFSADMAMSSLMLLQSTVNTNAPTPIFVEQSSHKQSGTQRDISQTSLEGDCVEMVETSERIGCLLWIRCRLTLVHSLIVLDLNNGADGPGHKLQRETARVISDGIEDGKRWGDPDSQALLMLECAKWDKKSADKSAQIKEIISLLSGRLNMPLRSVITLAQAAMLLDMMKTPESITFLNLSQKLLQNQLSCFSQNIVLDDGGSCLACSSNFCLPFLHLLHHTTSCIGNVLDTCHF
ncbi:cilia- and flagella-associated protein 54 [Eucyclogobius newberryi]|uniref:cilia- and flagella-associated protein 54 n=1 Tax=Eucyclogobius newberryi TaxID=166745 RepID=UPI003B5B4DE7